MEQTGHLNSAHLAQRDFGSIRNGPLGTQTGTDHHGLVAELVEYFQSLVHATTVRRHAASMSLGAGIPGTAHGNRHSSCLALVDPIFLELAGQLALQEVQQRTNRRRHSITRRHQRNDVSRSRAPLRHQYRQTPVCQFFHA